MKLLWDERAWKEYLEWQKDDRHMVKRINELLDDINKEPEHGIGRPEELKDSLAGCWSRRIDEKDRLVYLIETDTIEIISCKDHYEAAIEEGQYDQDETDQTVSKTEKMGTDISGSETK